MRPSAPTVLVALLSLAVASPAAESRIPSPEEVFGHQVGADRKLVPFPRVVEYLETLAALSGRVSIETPGRSTLDQPMPVVVLTSPANQGRLDELRDIARRLAKPAGLGPEEARELARQGKAIALVTCSIHATEVGSTQMAMEFVHEFATTEDPERLAWMDEVVLLLMPSINPDGQVLVGDWYETWLGTEYEGGRMPWLYHHYVGHDNNRDYYMLTQKETRVVNDVLYQRWFPQVFLDEHQMGSVGPRMFVPPQTDPLAADVHSLIFRQADVLGTNMGRRLEEAGKRGVGNSMIFDAYWPGGTRNTAWWKNVTGLLTEVASARIATPIFVDPSELRGDVKGLPDYTRRSNYPSPWQGGWWRLRDIVEYELVATWAYLESIADNREDILRNVYRMAHGEIERGSSEAPFAFVIPPDQHDPVAAGRLVELLQRHGVEVARAAEPLRLGWATFPAGTTVVPAAQPYRPFLLTMLRPQRYPEVRNDVDGEILPPYDVTSWSLPLAMGVEVVEATQPLGARLEPLAQPNWPTPHVDAAAAGHLLPHAADSVYVAMNRLLKQGRELYWLSGEPDGGAPGDVYIPSASLPAAALETLGREIHLPAAPLAAAPAGRHSRVTPARVGLYKPWYASMDEGWTRWLLEQYEFPFANVTNEDIRSGSFTSTVDVLLFSAEEAAIIAKGRPASDRPGRPFEELPPQWAGGLDEWPKAPAASAGGEKGKDEKTGGERIKEWVKAGGTVVALDTSARYFIDLLDLPVQDVLDGTSSDDFNAPGSMLRVHVDTRHPLGFGMRSDEAAYFSDSPAFATTLPAPSLDRRVVARYPDDERDVLVSGYLRGGERLERRAAVVDLRVEKGRVILIGFRAQHRAQPHRTFKLLFNALYRLEEVELGP